MTAAQPQPPPFSTNPALLPITASLGLSCGCVRPPSAPDRAMDVATPGRVVICDRHEEYAVVLRVTMRVAEPTAEHLAALLLASPLVDDETTAACIAAEQVENLGWRGRQPAQPVAAR